MHFTYSIRLILENLCQVHKLYTDWYLFSLLNKYEINRSNGLKLNTKEIFFFKTSSIEKFKTSFFLQTSAELFRFFLYFKSALIKF